MKSQRVVKVVNRPGREITPLVRLQGKWLKEVFGGLRAGDAVLVEQVNNKLILTKYKHETTTK